MAREISRRGVLAGALALAGLPALSACGLGTAGGFIPGAKLAGALQDVKALTGAQIGVGSKNFSEQVLVGKMAVILFQAAGAEVQDLTNIPGSSSSRQALVADQIQMVWEYTGTAWIAYQGNTDPIPDEQKQWKAVADADKKLKLIWLPPAPMNNTYGFALKRELAEKYGLKSLSDIKKVPVPERSFCVESEFNSRNDGFKPMLEKYGIPFGSEVPSNQVKIFDTGAIYEATKQGECTFGEVFTTDGRIKALDLVALEDDQTFFPLYNVCPVVREEVMAKYPQIADLFAPVSQALTNDVLLDLNARIDVNGEEPTDVALDWLQKNDFVTAT